MTTPVAGSIVRAFDALDLFHQRERLRVADVADALDIPKSSAYRLLITLRSVGALESADDGSFYLGLRLFEIGCASLLRRNLHLAASKPLQHLAILMRSTVQLGVLGENQVLFLEKYGLSGNPKTDPGQRGPVHATAIGKVLLAFAPTSTQEEFLGRQLPALTPKTVTSADALRLQLQEVRERGYAIGREEKRLGYFSVSRPIRQPYVGGVIGAIAVILTNAEGIGRANQTMQRACAEIESGLAGLGA